MPRHLTRRSTSWPAGLATSGARQSRSCFRRWPSGGSAGATRQTPGSGGWPLSPARANGAVEALDEAHQEELEQEELEQEELGAEPEPDDEGDDDLDDDLENVEDDEEPEAA